MSSNYVITLSNDFIQNTIDTVNPHWGPLGWVTYKRTYARFLDAQNRTEEWSETVKRVVEGNINLDPRLKGMGYGVGEALPDPKLVKSLTTEAQKLYKLIYGLAATPSGRNLWVSGTDYQRAHGDSLNNCWFVAIRPQAYGDSAIVPSYLDQRQEAVSMPFAFMFDQLMKGGGVGFSVTRSNIDKLPAVGRSAELTIIMDKDNGSAEESREAGAVDRDEWLGAHGGAVAAAVANDHFFYEVPDSREGWVHALAAVIDSHFSYFPQEKKSVVLDMSKVRARGTRIHGFGGTASGAAPLIEMLRDVNAILNEAEGRKLTSVDGTDMGNLVGKAVVAGNVRRSAELALGDWDDDGFVTMKQDQDKLYHHRWASNNSVAVSGDPKQYEAIADAIRTNGEPGIVDLSLSQNYGRLVDGENKDADPYAEGTNPCGEITLENGEPCNLFEIFPNVAEEQEWDLAEAFALGTRYTKRVTFGSYDWEVSRNVIERNRRIGISMSGIQDWFLSRFGHRVVTGFEESTAADGTTKRTPVYDEQAVKAVDALYHHVVDADAEYSKELGCATSVKHTTVKPSGTVAKLAGVSEGMHFHYAPYLIQRIRFQDDDPLLPALLACGYKIEPDVYTAHTMCVEFPVKAAHAEASDFASAGNVSAEEQLATQAFLQTYWSDNAVSCTVTFQEAEKPSLPAVLSAYAGSIKSTSMLPYTGAGFKQAPKEPISEEVYLEKLGMIRDTPQKAFARINGNRDESNLELVDQTDCVGGACPVR
ncbi:MAG: ribonucleoside-triphosphate reductase, adenosylcobalamin-dependent [Bifidobacteriaceae bacterium]|jgi:ribonucleoside-triphosphate reductase|nr:ribonucleoside-triphosphate reductase, adenosylcobalamin-dependent [Bifidobacteriaceae bacterium]